MAKDFPEQRRPNVPSTGYAAEGELISADQPLLENPEGELRADPADHDGTDFDDEALAMDVATQPMSELTSVNDASGSSETPDGLDEIDEMLRQQVEDRALGDDLDYKA